jgi:Polyketide cyclase / dehydrase and lipid transport
MRYRDQPTVQVEQRIVGDPSTIWDLVTDITLPARFSTELQSVEWLDGATAVEVGNRFRGHNRNPALGAWSTECTIVDVEPGRRWAWTVTDDRHRMATWGFEVDPGHDTVIVRQWARMGPDRSGLNIAIDAMPDKEGRIISRRMDEWRTNMEANLAGIRALVEGTDRPAARRDDR